MIRYQHNFIPDLEAICALYAASPLRRPIGEPERMRAMFQHSNVVISAWKEDRLVGLLRGWTDFAFDGYVCDLAIHPAHQKAGIGKRLLEEAQSLGQGVRWVLLASPLAKDYYAHVGWSALNNAWMLSLGEPMPDYETFQSRFAELAKKA